MALSPSAIKFASKITLFLAGAIALAWISLFLLIPIASLFWKIPLSSLPGFWRSSVAHQALSLTLKSSLAATLLAIFFGTPTAYLLERKRFPGRSLLRALVDLPMVFPPVVGGLALLIAYGRFGLVGRFLDRAGITIGFTGIAVVMAQTFVAAPFYIRSARAGFASVNPLYEQAASTLGAAPLRVFLTVTLPLSVRSLTAGIALCWARAVGEFGATYMFAGNFEGRTQTMPLAILSQLENDLNAAVALSLLLGLICFFAFVVAEWLTERREDIKRNA